MAVPNIFGTATAAIPLSQLDQNFATAITLGNTAVYLGNTTTSLGNVTLTNVTISSGTSNIAANVSTAVGLLPEAQGGTGTTTGYYGFKNRIINGAMVIDQRNAGASVALSASASFYAADRFVSRTDTGTGNTAQQSPTAPSGFVKSLLVTIGTGASPSSGAVNFIDQRIEGFNVADFGWGTASAATISLSFWVYSSLTGTFGVALRNSAVNRCYVSTYSISSANTWEYKTITIVGDTGGTWLTNNGVGIYLSFDIGEGSSRSTSTTNSWIVTNTPGLSTGVKLCQTSGATFYITGVQLEKGSTATSFDYRPYGTELQLCQRYYETASVNPRMYGATSDVVITPVVFQVAKRATPTVAYSSIVYVNASNLVTQNINTQAFGARWTVTSSAQSEWIATYNASAEL